MCKYKTYNKYKYLTIYNIYIISININIKNIKYAIILFVFIGLYLSMSLLENWKMLLSNSKFQKLDNNYFVFDVAALDKNEIDNVIELEK